MRANRPEKSGGGAESSHPSAHLWSHEEQEKGRAQARGVEARARGELKDDSESESEEEEYEEEPAPKQKSASKKRKAAEEAEEEDDDDDDDSAGEDSEEEVPANRDRPRIKVDFTGVNAKEKTLILSSRGGDEQVPTPHTRFLHHDAQQQEGCQAGHQKPAGRGGGGGGHEILHGGHVLRVSQTNRLLHVALQVPPGPLGQVLRRECAHNGGAEAHGEPPEVLQASASLRRVLRR